METLFLLSCSVSLCFWFIRYLFVACSKIRFLSLSKNQSQMLGRLKPSFILISSSMWEHLWSRIMQLQQLRRKICAWRIMHVQLWLLCSANMLNFAIPEWIDHFFYKQGAQSRRVGWNSWAKSPGELGLQSLQHLRDREGQRGDYSGCQSNLFCNHNQLTTPSLSLTAARAVGGLASLSSCPGQVAPRLWDSFVLPILPSSPAPYPTACSPLPWSSLKIRWNRGDQPNASVYILRKNAITK